MELTKESKEFLLWSLKDTISNVDNLDIISLRDFLIGTWEIANMIANGENNYAVIAIEIEEYIYC